MTKHFLVIVSLLSFPLSYQAAGYHHVKDIQIGGEGGWDYLSIDSPGRRLYVSHATKVVVIDTANHLFDGKVIEVAEAIEELLGDWSA